MIYYFIGDPIDGIELTTRLEDISRERQRKRICRKVYGRYRKWMDKAYPNIASAVELAERYNEKVVAVSPNDCVEGCRTQRLYYLHRYVIKWCSKYSFKAFLIKLFGKEVRI